jgi:sugar phosphate permease
LGIGMVLGYVCVFKFGGNPYALAFCFGFVGLMLYGPDTLLCGAASVQVAGERNAVAVAALVNGIGSFGPVIQEEVIGHLIAGKDTEIAMRNTNLLALSMSVAFVLMMLMVIWSVRTANKRNLAQKEGP